MSTESTVKTVPFNSIHIPEEENIREDTPKVKELAENIRVNGLIEPLVVVNGGDGVKTYRLLAGFRRAAALKALKWGSKPINVTIREEWDPLVTAAENMNREDVNPIDMSRYCWGLVNGQYNSPAPKGSELRKYSFQEIAVSTSLSAGSVQNYVRVNEKLSGDVRKKVRKHPDAPISLLLRCISFGKEEVEVDEKTGEKTKHWIPDDARQLRVFETWAKKKEELAEAGLSRSKRGTKNGEPKRKTSRVLEACIKVLNRKKDEDAAYPAYAAAFRFALGESDRLPGITKTELEETLAEMKEKAKKADS